MNEKKFNVLYYLVRYRLKEILGFIVFILLILLFGLTFNYSTERGISCTPAARIEIEVKK